jgi:hypothetical protein
MFDRMPFISAVNHSVWETHTANAERTDVFNGFLLLPSLDRAFEFGFITSLTGEK